MYWYVISRTRKLDLLLRLTKCWMEQQIFDGIMDVQLFEGCGEIYCRFYVYCHWWQFILVLMTHISVFVCLFVCLFVLCPIREFLIHFETSPLPINRGSKTKHFLGSWEYIVKVNSHVWYLSRDGNDYVSIRL